ncbi:MAG: selenide, water dikinase SelD [Flavobacteriales bacterium]|nr:selenide, water dikinase SelD [Flavobacteriales bacterium]
MTEPVRLTQYSHGAGCGCKIAPAVLETILKSELGTLNEPRLLVGYGSRDDAAVYDIGNGRAIISTTDFFSPIVDDAFDFGRIAATNALSDIYAMGGKPLLAVAILGWPIEKLGPELAQRVVEGGRKACHDAGIPLAGGHSIDAPEPFFGLAVTGEVEIANIKRNDTAKEGDVIYLTKPLGVGILSTAQKRGKLRTEHERIGPDLMSQLNRVGYELGQNKVISAMTDVTGFGLGGHLLEICNGSGLSAEIQFEKLPVIPEALTYIAEGCYPDGAFRNWKSYGEHISGASEMKRMLLLSDPQTSGGLMFTMASDQNLSDLSSTSGDLASIVQIGKMVSKAAKTIFVT